MQELQEVWVRSLGQEDPWVKKIPGVGNGYPLQYSCLENIQDRGAWQATDLRAAKSRTQMSMPAT